MVPSHSSGINGVGMSGYRRRRGPTKKPGGVILIVAEGSETEIRYFEGFRQRNLNLRIKAVTSPDKTPLGVVKYARKKMIEEDIKIGKGDEVWCVFDADDNDDNDINEACLACGKDMKIALSNPCFEFWYILHFQCCTNHLENCDEAIRELKRYIPEYTKTKRVYQILSEKQSQALINSEKVNKHHLGQKRDLMKNESNPSSQVHLLVLSINEKVRKLRDA